MPDITRSIHEPFIYVLESLIFTWLSPLYKFFNININFKHPLIGYEKKETNFFKRTHNEFIFAIYGLNIQIAFKYMMMLDCYVCDKYPDCVIYKARKITKAF